MVYKQEKINCVPSLFFTKKIQKISPTNPKDITNKSKNFTEKSKRKSWFTSKGRLTVCHLSFSLQCFPRQPIWDTQPKPSKPSPWRFPRDMRKCQSRRIWYICHLGTVPICGAFLGPVWPLAVGPQGLNLTSAVTEKVEKETELREAFFSYLDLDYNWPFGFDADGAILGSYH